MFLKKIPINLVLLILLSIYYIYFVNKGIVIYDEGYYAHISEKILNREVPYRDFFLQFTPGYFYLLALFYKIFGVSIIAGRILSFILCLGIGLVTLLILDRFKTELKLKLISFAAIAAFGFPLINNMALLAWISVFLSLLTILLFVDKKYIYLGLVLSLLLFTKQNLGIYFFIVTNICLFLFKTKLRNIIQVNMSFFIPTFIWFFYFFFLLNGFDKFLELLMFNSRYLSVYPFSYPPLTMIFQPLGIVKLIPYYFPLILSVVLIWQIIKKRNDPNVLYFLTISLAGFYGTVYPTSDLLHVYPFFGPLLVSSILFFKQDKKIFPFFRIFIFLVIGVGLYLALFREYYRYQPAYRYQKFKTELPRMKNIYIDEPLATDLSYLNLFFLTNTKKNDSILCYPFCPMVYFILERKNPTRHANYYPGYLTKQQEEEVLKEIKKEKVRFIVTFLDYKFNKPISKFIQNQKTILQRGQFRVFEVR